MSEISGFPTILIAEWDVRVRTILVGILQQQGYMVLNAEDSWHALDFVKTHSRPIQLILVDGNPEGQALAAALQMYRPKMQVVFTSEISSDCMPDSPQFEIILAKVRELLDPPMSRTAHA